MLAVLMVLIAFAGIGYADQPVPAVPETQGLVTSTGAEIVGMVTETDAGAWTLTSSGVTLYTVSVGPSAAGYTSLTDAELAAITAAGGTYILFPGSTNQVVSVSIPESMLNQQVPSGPSGYTWAMWIGTQMSYNWVETIQQGGLHTGSLNPGEVRYTTAYDANILAQAGHTVLTKGVNINTGNKVLTQSNFKAQTGLTYIATSDAGNVVGSENLMLDGAGNFTTASDRMLCPFASQPVNVIPAYCNIVQMGNSYDVTVGSVTSTMSERFVGTDATIPVQLDQDFNVKPYGTTDGSIPAMGSASAYIKVHIQEARGYTYTNATNPFGLPLILPGTPLKAEDLQYSETTSTSGVIQQFTKVIHYQSGKSLMP